LSGALRLLERLLNFFLAHLLTFVRHRNPFLWKFAAPQWDLSQRREGAKTERKEESGRLDMLIGARFFTDLDCRLSAQP
jgi:hypothetical protein